jgi:hypothetical protein
MMISALQYLCSGSMLYGRWVNAYIYFQFQHDTATRLQLWRQFPGAFQFNERLLASLVEHAYSCRFGSFLFDCEKDRQRANVPETTVSIWTHVLHDSHRASFTNPRFIADTGSATPSSPLANLNAIISPNTDVDYLVVWPYWTHKWNRTLSNMPGMLLR